MKAVDTWVCRRADVVAAPTEDMRRVLIARGLPPEHIRVQGHWLDEGRIQPASRQNRWRERQGLSPEIFVALYAGTVGHISGAEVVVETARLLADHQKVLFLFAGAGPLKASLQEKAKEYRLANIRFVSFQPEEDLNLMQAAADAGVEPGSPVARFIEEGGFGWVAPPADARALAEAILVAASDCDECRRRGERARQFFVREFGRRAVAGRFARELESLHERHGLRR
jgi:colanic acid biosynthesis glycosyl transferase WcaI